MRRNHEISKHGLCKPIILKYVNGICYAYTPGIPPTIELMLTDDFLAQAASKLARFVLVKLVLLVS